eukprot:1138534-Pelagomonas_calceolata.AAC.7
MPVEAHRGHTHGCEAGMSRHTEAVAVCLEGTQSTHRLREVDNSYGIPHILEHSVLCGSRKYPIKASGAPLAGQSCAACWCATTFASRSCVYQGNWCAYVANDGAVLHVGVVTSGSSMCLNRAGSAWLRGWACQTHKEVGVDTCACWGPRDACCTSYMIRCILNAARDGIAVLPRPSGAMVSVGMRSLMCSWEWA